MELRFGHSNMKESYLVEAKLRKRKSGETFRDLGQSIEDLYRRAYPASPDTAIEDEIKKLEDKKLIEKSNSPWSSGLVLVQKKDLSWRLCVDYRKLNDKTIKDAYPIPRIEDNIDALSGAKWMSVLDLSMAYHQVPMNPADKEKT
ncbi:Hypothetical predicted protein [Mytilus galloprovincialis]|uniref:Reverse transcriptase domain-containing protein n=1 Tax=Mytilus galloprovincialis TaxID=29158 RepID=A0A8B6DGP9_MYTGA|nr:Hypothetical predicted protein [Mytilus galloprovincialis]